ncbi:MAG: Fe-S-containing protein [Bacillota bacterium]|nr:Fe-S-containing protein [Bacillota bacterium]
MNEKNKQLKSKKDQFTGSPKSKLPLILIVVAILGIGIFSIVSLMSNQESETSGSFFGEPSAPTRSYIGRVVTMTRVEPLIDDAWATITLEELEEKDIVFFEVENDEGFMVPLMAYITPSGRVFTGSSMCEPCQGRYFSLAGETLVCDTCRTTYTIENHEFLSGSQACGQYPPVYMKPEVDNGLVKIALSDIMNWEIRAY